jgi:hypothetical protein
MKRRRQAIAGAGRMTIEEVVRKVLRDEHADVIRESVRAVAQELMDAEISELIGARHPKAAPGQLLPELLAASQALRAGAAGGRPAGVRVRGLHPPRRPAGGVARATSTQAAREHHRGALARGEDEMLDPEAAEATYERAEAPAGPRARRWAS